MNAAIDATRRVVAHSAQVVGVKRRRTLIEPKDTTKCRRCYDKKIKCRPAQYNYPNEKCDACRHGGFPCGPRQPTKEHKQAAEENAGGPPHAADTDGQQPDRGHSPPGSGRRGPLPRPGFLGGVAAPSVLSSPQDTQEAELLLRILACQELKRYLECRENVLQALLSDVEAQTPLVTAQTYVEHTESEAAKSLQRLRQSSTVHSKKNRSSLFSAFTGAFAPFSKSHVRRSTSSTHSSEPTINRATEVLVWEVFADPATEHDTGFADSIGRNLALHASDESLRNAPEKVMALHNAFLNMSKRMQDLWRELNPWKRVGTFAHPDESAFSPTILLAVDRCACLLKHLPPEVLMLESSFDSFHRTPLHLACEDAAFDSFECFDNCQDSFLEVRDQFHWTAIHVAASSGHLHALRYLCSRGANLAVLDIWGRSPLMLASAHGHTEAVEFLLDNECNVDARGLRQPRAVFFAVKHKRMETAHLLLKRGSRISHSGDDVGLLREIRAQKGLELLIPFACEQDSKERETDSDETLQAVDPPPPSFIAPRDASGTQADGTWERLMNHSNDPSRLPTRNFSVSPRLPSDNSTSRVHSNLQSATPKQMETSEQHPGDPPSSSDEPPEDRAPDLDIDFDSVFGELPPIPNLDGSNELADFVYSQQVPGGYWSQPTGNTQDQ